jgi:hypothetical protein
MGGSRIREHVNHDAHGELIGVACLRRADAARRARVIWRWNSFASEMGRCIFHKLPFRESVNVFTLLLICERDAKLRSREQWAPHLITWFGRVSEIWIAPAITIAVISFHIRISPIRARVIGFLEIWEECNCETWCSKIVFLVAAWVFAACSDVWSSEWILLWRQWTVSNNFYYFSLNRLTTAAGIL